MHPQVPCQQKGHRVAHRGKVRLHARVRIRERHSFGPYAGRQLPGLFKALFQNPQQFLLRGIVGAHGRESGTGPEALDRLADEVPVFVESLRELPAEYPTVLEGEENGPGTTSPSALVMPK